MTEQAAEKEPGLPFDPMGLALRLLGRAPWLLLGWALAALLAIWLSLQFGSKVYQSETLLLYKPARGSDSLTLQTQLNLVKTRPNLAQVQKRLGLKGELEQLARDFEVRLQRNTDLIIVSARAPQAETAARKARTLREVFLEQQDQSRKSKLQAQLGDLESRLQRVSQALKKAEKELEVFTLENRIIDLDKEAQWYLEQLTSLQVLYEQAKVEQSSVQIQAGNIDRIIGDLKARIEKEKAENASMSNLGDINIQVQRLRDALHDDKQDRSGRALLKEKKLEYERALRLRERGLVSQSEVDKLEAAYESQKALTVDTQQTREWKQKIDSLNAVAIPKGPTVTASGTVLQEMTLKSFDIQLSLVTQDQKLRRLREAVLAAQQRLEQIPRLQQKFLALRREVETRAAEKSNLEALVGETRRAFESRGSEFSTAAEAVAPLYPVESNRKKVFLLALLVLAGGWSASLLLLCVLDRSLLTPGELAQVLPESPIALLPAPAGKELEWSFLAREIRRHFDHQGGLCLALVGWAPAGPSPAQALCQAWSEQGEQGYWFDLGNLGKLPQALAAPQGMTPPTAVVGPVSAAQLRPESLTPWLAEARSRGWLLILEVSGAARGVAADLVAGQVDGCILLCPARTPRSQAQQLLARLRGEGCQRFFGLLSDAPALVRRWSKP